MMQNIQQLDWVKAEVLMRGAFIITMGLILMVVDLPSLVPSPLAYMVAMLANTYVFSCPKFTVGITQMIPLFLSILVFILFLSFALCAAATVSSALMVVLYAIFCVIFMNLFMGNAADSLGGSFASTIIAMIGLISVSLRETVQKGGLPLLKSLITARGVNNPLAFLSNCLICWSWASLCYTIGILIPPWRTSRDHKSLPQIVQAISIICNSTHFFEVLKAQENATTDDTAPNKGNSDTAENPTTENSGSPDSSNGTSCNELSIPNLDLLRMETMKLLDIWQCIEPAKDAAKCAFEPNVLDGTFANLQPEMLALLQSTKDMIMAVILFRTNLLYNRHQKHKRDEEEPRIDTAFEASRDTEPILLDIRTVLQSTVQALINPNSERTSFAIPPSLSEDLNYPFYLLALIADTKQFCLAAQAYNNAYYHPQAATAEQIMKNILHFVTTSLNGLLLPYVIFVTALKRGQYSRGNVLWASKWACGFIGFFVMAVYWDGFNSFSIQVSPDFLITGKFKGWYLMGYAFAFQTTVEGTIKRGLMRILGTCIGGFLAWVGMMLCSLTWDATDPINPYAFVVYVVLGNVFCLHLALPAGIDARVKKAYDHGDVGGYAGTVLMVISTETFAGSGDVNGLTLNRMAATCAGVFMAIIISVIPPFVKGKNPFLLLEYCDILQDGLNALLEEVLAKKGPLKDGNECLKPYLDKAASVEKKAAYLIADSGRIHALAAFRIPKELKKLLTTLNLSKALLARLLSVSERLPNNDDDVSNITNEDKGGSEWTLLEPAIRAILDGKGPADPELATFVAADESPREENKSYASDFVCKALILRLALQSNRKELERFQE